MGTIDLYGCADGEDSAGNCTLLDYPIGCLLDHYFMEVRPYNSCKRKYNEFHCCLRARGIPSGSPGGPVSYCDFERAYSCCQRLVYEEGKNFCSPPSTEGCKDPTYKLPIPSDFTCKCSATTAGTN
jgi:hypothetical protein